MKQSVKSPQENPEQSREDMVTAYWFGLEMQVQVNMISEFIESLQMPYHKDFFKRMSPTKIINERWFLQFVERHVTGGRDEK